jgi:hypothetical protein
VVKTPEHKSLENADSVSQVSTRLGEQTSRSAWTWIFVTLERWDMDWKLKKMEGHLDGSELDGRNEESDIVSEG